MKDVKKCLAAVFLSGVLSVSALAMTALAQTNGSTVHTIKVEVTEYYGNPSPTEHSIYRKTTTFCETCGEVFSVEDDEIGVEEHDYDIFMIWKTV